MAGCPIEPRGAAMDDDEAVAYAEDAIARHLSPIQSLPAEIDA